MTDHDAARVEETTEGFRSALEEKVAAKVRESRDELVGLIGELVACDTTAREGAMPARDEEKLQRILAARLEALGAAPELWEPEPTGAGDRFLPGGLDFVGRPQLVATAPGAGGGRSLLLNGHIDAVDVEPRERWSSDPLRLRRARRRAVRPRCLRHEGRHRLPRRGARDAAPARRAVWPATSCSAR